MHVVSWKMRSHGQTPMEFYSDLNSLRSEHFEGNPFIHTAALSLTLVSRIANKVLSDGYPSSTALLPVQLQFQTFIKDLHKKYSFDAVVQASSHHFTGYPPILPGVPTVFDYVDTSPPDVEAYYVNNAHHIVAVSHYLCERIRETYGRECELIPNGLHLNRPFDANRCREKWGLHGKKVISLLGLTCSDRLYFIDAIAKLLPEFPNVVFLGAGTGEIGDRIKARCTELGVPHVMAGWVSPKEIGDYFAASDIGLYPGDENPYFDGACPLKVLEYAGARVPMVTSNLSELRRLGFKCLITAPSTVDGFAAALHGVLKDPPREFPDMTVYDWSSLADRLANSIRHAKLAV